MIKNNLSSNGRALAAIILGGSLVSFTSVLVNLAHVGPSVSAFYRLAFGGGILMMLAFFRQDQIWLGIKSLWLPFLCALLFGLDLFFWHRSILFVGPGLATILGNMQVFFVALFAVFFLKERLGWRLLVAIPVAMCGLFLIVRTGWGAENGDFKWGVLFGLITALAYAGYILVLRKSRSEKNKQRYSLIANMAWISVLAALMLGLSVMLEPGTTFTIPDWQSWWALLGLGVMGQVFGWVLISKGLPHVDASVGGLALLLQPALAFAWDILFFSRPTNGLEYAGAAIVLSAIYLGSVGNKKR